MRDFVITQLSTKFPSLLATELVDTYQQLVAKHRGGHLASALVEGGRFVEHTLRLIEHARNGKVKSSIKSVAETIKQIESDASLPDSLRLLIPRVAYGIVYNIRNKRNAVHVNEIDPKPIDVSLMVSAAGWILAELLRPYHKADEKAVADAMLALTRGSIPLVEAINGEMFVSQSVPAKYEILLLLAQAKPGGMSRTTLGRSAKCSQPSVTTTLAELSNPRKRHVHKTVDGNYFITSTGEQVLSEWLINLTH